MSPDAIDDILRRAVHLQNCMDDVQYMHLQSGAGAEHGPLPPQALWMARIIRDAQARAQNIIVLKAVGHLKSTVINILMAQDILDGHHVIFGTKAGDVIRRSNEAIRRMMIKAKGPEVVKQAPLWQEHQFLLPGETDENPHWYGTTPTRGIEGMRGTRAYLDDLIDEESMVHQSARDTAERWYEHTLQDRLNKGAHVTVVGSPWHPEDFYMYLADRMEVHVFPMLRSPLPAAYERLPNVHWHGLEYDILWPEHWTPDAIAKKRGDLSPTAFSQRFMCDPRSIRAGEISPEQFGYHDRGPCWIERWERFMQECRVWVGHDPAPSTPQAAKTHSDSAMIVFGFELEPVFRICALERLCGQWTWPLMLEKMDYIMDTWKPERWVIERSPGSKDLISYLNHTQTPGGHYIPLIPSDGQTPGGTKQGRIRSMIPHVMAHRILLHSSMREMVMNLVYWDPKSDAGVDDWDAFEVGCRAVFEMQGGGGDGPRFSSRTSGRV